MNWKVLQGALVISSGTLTVELSNLNGQVTADAIRLQRIGSIPVADTPQIELIAPTGVPMPSGSAFNVGTPFAGETYDSTFTVTNIGTANLSLTT